MAINLWLNRYMLVTAQSRPFQQSFHKLSIGTVQLLQQDSCRHLGFSTLARPIKLSPTLNQTSPTTQAHLRAQQLSSHFSTHSRPTDKMSQFTVRKVGAPNTPDYRMYIEKDGMPVSPFHDIPLYANDQQTILNMVVEIPRWTNAKMEVSQSILS